MTDRTAHILILTDTLQAGGADRALTDMSNYWMDIGHRVTVLSLKSAKVVDFYPLSNRVNRLYRSERDTAASAIMKVSRNLWVVRRLRRACQSIAPDTIISFIDVPNILTPMAASGLPSRVIISERGCPDVAASNPELAGHFALPKHWRLLRRRL